MAQAEHWLARRLETEGQPVPGKQVCDDAQGLPAAVERARNELPHLLPVPKLHSEEFPVRHHLEGTAAGGIEAQCPLRLDRAEYLRPERHRAREYGVTR